MSLTADSPVHSSSSDDFVAFLDAELDATFEKSADLENFKEEKREIDDASEGDSVGEDNQDLDLKRVKRCKVEFSEGMTCPGSFFSQDEVTTEVLGSSHEKNMCPHPGVYAMQGCV